MNQLRRMIALLLAAALLGSAVSCKKEITAEDLMADIETQNASENDLDEDFCRNYSGKAFALLRNAYDEKDGNVVISPLGILYNMSMLSNGASEGTQQELTGMLGKTYDSHRINVYMHSITEKFKNSDTSKLYFRNAMWFNSGKNAAPSEEFLTTAKSYYKASAYKETFGKDAVTNINNWASNETDMVADYLINSLSADDPMQLFNITLLDADWESPISPENVMDGTFVNFDKQEEKVQMMSSYERIYISSDEVDGFIKYYAGEDYAFVVILPKVALKSALGDTIGYFSKGEMFRKLINGRRSRTVDASFPKFSCEYIGGVKNILQGVEAGSAFHSSYARLKGVGTADDNLYVGDLTVRTAMSVTERGTSKGTGAKVGDPSVATNVIPVSIDRPFIFAVVDTNNYLPIILGAVTTVRG